MREINIKLCLILGFILEFSTAKTLEDAEVNVL